MKVIAITIRVPSKRLRNWYIKGLKMQKRPYELIGNQHIRITVLSDADANKVMQWVAITRELFLSTI